MDFIHYELISNEDKKLITCTIFLDLNKSFNCVDHKILLQRYYTTEKKSNSQNTLIVCEQQTAVHQNCLYEIIKL